MFFNFSPKIKQIGSFTLATILLGAILSNSLACRRNLSVINGRETKYIRKPHKADPYFDKIYGHGIDLSHHNADPDWELLDIDFIILKASEGSSYKDPTFSLRAEKSRNQGIFVGAYHFFTGTDNADKEFDNFNKVIKGKIDIIPVIDIERKPKKVSRKEFNNRFLKFMMNIKKEYGVYPIIYTSEGFYYIFLKELVETKLKNENQSPILWFGDVGQEYKKYNLTPHIHQKEIKKIKGTKGKVDFNELHCELDKILLKPKNKISEK